MLLLLLNVHSAQCDVHIYLTYRAVRRRGFMAILSKSLEETAVDEVMKIGGWKTEQVAWYYIEATTSAPAGAA